ncbi:AbrB/MazE/SpoVT family DNA-binding domain-containing protein [Desulfolutivibrio sulfoxidireducens]|uniref:AbrB/MazE/SpoVT family DNA-binding domain-containing protein n=1 Tax=Desulfolutivibrio sulfoxidireducens TaxID=2773299 RepID=UPI00159E552E|nr:AbrB/MazE/SpoVT family DNA-binding domain-containing protein [Desulfolutivibrio sulfoxidireducens]QLA14712.1 AbrB/MazE/SpoVT family DNA-binding domain-containing protein [Desulfolutivibrio sulfoxidireducens]
MESCTQAYLDKYGRLSIPKPMRERLGLRPGAPVTLQEGGEGLLVRPANERTGLVEKDGLLVFMGETTQDPGDILSHLRADRLRDILSCPE